MFGSAVAAREVSAGGGRGISFMMRGGADIFILFYFPFVLFVKVFLFIFPLWRLGSVWLSGRGAEDRVGGVVLLSIVGDGKKWRKKEWFDVWG